MTDKPVSNPDKGLFEMFCSKHGITQGILTCNPTPTVICEKCLGQKASTSTTNKS